MDKVTRFIEVTAEPRARRDGKPGKEYRVTNTLGESPMVNSGWFPTPKSVAAFAFTPQILESHQAEIVKALEAGFSISISLRDAYITV